MHVRIGDDAKDDLRRIRAYLEPRNPSACERVLISVFAVLEQLEQFPFLGRFGREEGTREISVPKYPYIIVYSIPDEYYIDIERVLHSAMKWPP